MSSTWPAALPGDPDPGVHSAADLLLRRWGRVNLIGRPSRQAASVPALAGPAVAARARRASPSPSCGPLEFRMGAPEDDRRPTPSRIVRHFRRIERTIAYPPRRSPSSNTAFRPSRVPRGDPLFQELPLQPGQRGSTRPHYCNWLSEKAGIRRGRVVLSRAGQLRGWSSGRLADRDRLPASHGGRMGISPAARALKRLAPSGSPASSLPAMPGRG